MATSKKVKTVSTGFMGLTEAQNRLLLLGALCQTPGRIDFSELANLAGITAASARTMYPKAKKKLEAFHAADPSYRNPNTPLDNALNALDSVKKLPVARSYKKRKTAEVTTADEETEDGQPAEHDIENNEIDDAEPTEPTNNNDEN